MLKGIIGFARQAGNNNPVTLLDFSVIRNCSNLRRNPSIARKGLSDSLLFMFIRVEAARCAKLVRLFGAAAQSMMVSVRTLRIARRPQRKTGWILSLFMGGLILLGIVLHHAAALAARSPEPSFGRWSKIELSFEGPRSIGRGEPNPFAVSFDVVFTGPDGKSVKVPGFYDGDGKGGLDGNIWKVRFAADRNGSWTYRTESSHASLNRRSGRFQVTDPSPNAPAFYRLGRLEYVGERYLKFREGGYWIKAGADEPENILGKAFGDWEAKKREIDYLASQNINSIYVMTHNLEGDNNDVWPWLGLTAEEAKTNHDRFDIAKLEKWREFFEYVQSKGLVIHLVLEDDSAWKQYDQARYYREMVARFGYLPALIFNFNEEHNENYSLADALAYMKLLGELDPYKHPRAIHNVNLPVNDYIDSRHVELASIQTPPRRPASLNRIAVDWVEASLAKGKRPLVVSFDEGRPAEDRRSWWSVYLGGGIWESLVPVPGGFAEQSSVWRELAVARAFMESLPVHKMYPANHLVAEGEAFCLARPGEVYALYLPQGGRVTVQLTPGNRYSAEWFDPRTGNRKPAATIGGGRQSFTAPDELDWALRLARIEGSTDGEPAAMSAKLYSQRGEKVPVRLALFASGAAEYEILVPPRNGRLTGSGWERIYTPKPGFTGTDSFQWRAKVGNVTSNTATVSILCNAQGTNTPPKALDQVVKAAAGQTTAFILRYEDEDGPGPYVVRIVAPPKHGTAEGLDNDILYTPAKGFKGQDSFEWVVNDGNKRSNRARVTLIVK